MRRLVRQQPIHKQEDLRSLLRDLGFDVTQATLSRDLRELKIVKAVDTDGALRYQGLEVPHESSRFHSRVSGNLLVVRTRPGMAAPLAYRIDGLNLREILGTVAGEDTVLAVVAEDFDAREVQAQLKEIIERG